MIPTSNTTGYVLIWSGIGIIAFSTWHHYKHAKATASTSKSSGSATAKSNSRVSELLYGGSNILEGVKKESKGTYKDFAETIRKKITADDYSYSDKEFRKGAYRFRPIQLVHLQLVKELPKDKFEWADDLTNAKFFADKGLQDRSFAKMVQYYKQQIINSYPTFIRVRGEIAGISGLIAGAHVFGMDGLSKMVKGEEVKDSKGFTIQDYITEFDNYNI